jgi:hypothetical protein
MPTEGNINRASKLTQQRVRDYQREKDKNEDYPSPREMKTIATLSHFFLNLSNFVVLRHTRLVEAVLCP